MKKTIRITESHLKTLVRNVLLEQGQMNEYGRKGLWKPEWTEEDQTLAMYNALYGIEELGINKSQVANDVIGSSVDAFNQQTSNFTFLHTGQGLDREHKLQPIIYERYKDLPKAQFKKLCLDIIHYRLEHPEIAVTKKKLGEEIGSKREEIQKGRENALIAKGVDPYRIGKMKVIGSRPLNPPSEEEPASESMTSLKDQIRDFLKSVHDRILNITSVDETKPIADDIEFIIDYIESEKMIAENRKENPKSR